MYDSNQPQKLHVHGQNPRLHGRRGCIDYCIFSLLTFFLIKSYEVTLVALHSESFCPKLKDKTK